MTGISAKKDRQDSATDLTEMHTKKGCEDRELSNEELVFHKYTTKVLDTSNSGHSKTYNPVVVKEVTSLANFPTGSTSSHNSNIRISPTPVQFKGHLVQDKFFVVNMFNAKADQQSRVNDIELPRYTETTSGSKKNGARDNRKWVRFNYDAYTLTLEKDQTLKGFQEVWAKTQPASAAAAAGAERVFGVGFEHEKIDLSFLNVVDLSSSASGELQAVVGHYAGQLVKKDLEEDPKQNLKSTIVLGSRVFYEKGSSSHGLQEMLGHEGKIAYDGQGRGVLLKEPCTGHFFQNILVSEFLERFFGPASAGIADQKMLDRASAILRDVRVVVADPTGENKTTTIKSLGYITEKDLVSLRALAKPSSALISSRLPLINIGNLDNPEFHPAELCKIIGDDGNLQPFDDQVPFIPTDKLFSPDVNKDEHRPLNGDPFPQAKSNGFTVVVVNMVTPIGNKSVRAVDHDVIVSFKQEIGNRYNNSLASSVNTFGTIESTKEKLGDSLAFLKPNIKTVAVVVHHHSISTGELDKIRTMFDTRLGIQCNLVNGRDLSRRFHPVHHSGMKKMTGGVVQNIFGRAKIAKASQSVEKPDTFTQVFGIHIHELGKTSGNYLVDIITISGQDVQRSRATSDVFKALDEKALASRLSSYIEASRYESSRKLTIYIHGLDRGKQNSVLGLLNTKIQAWFLKDAKPFKPYFLTMSSLDRRSHILISEKDKYIPLNKDHHHDFLSFEALSKRAEEAEKVTASAFSIPHVSSNRKTHTPSLVTYLAFCTFPPNGRGDAEQANGRFLSTKDTPAILRLAGEASMRSRLHLFKKDADKVAADKKLKDKEAGTGKTDVCDWGIKAVRPELKDTFYFL